MESWLWNPGCGILAVESCLWSYGCGFLAVESWLWSPGCRFLAAGCGVLTGCEILPVESWLWSLGGILGAPGSILEPTAAMRASGVKTCLNTM